MVLVAHVMGVFAVADLVVIVVAVDEIFMKDIYRINPFIRIYECNNIKALFNMLNLKTLYISQNNYENMLIEPSSQILEEEFIVSQSFNSIDYFRKNVPQQKNNDISVAYFLLNSACNFMCKYCFIESRIEKNDESFMSREIAEKGIQLLQKNIDRKYETTIIFYGGEPFLNFDVMKYIVQRTKELEMNVKFNVVSNGSIIDTEIINFIKKYKIDIGISIDGLKNTNDEMRIDNEEKGTFDKIISTISILSQNKINFGISCTISKHNMKKIDEIIILLDKYNIKGMGYNLPAENNDVFINKNEMEIIVNNLLKAEDIIFEKRIYEDRIINRRLKSFVEKTRWIKDCAGYGHQIAITPKGQVGVCHGLWPDEINKNGNTYYEIDVDYENKITEHPIWKEWYNRTPFNMPQCWNCEAISLCGGGCAQKPFLREGSIWNIDTEICILMKKVVPWIIWKYFDVKVKPEFNTDK